MILYLLNEFVLLSVKTIVATRQTSENYKNPKNDNGPKTKNGCQPFSTKLLCIKNCTSVQSVSKQKTPGNDRFSSSGAHPPTNTCSVTLSCQPLIIRNAQNWSLLFWNGI